MLRLPSPRISPVSSPLEAILIFNISQLLETPSKPPCKLLERIYQPSFFASILIWTAVLLNSFTTENRSRQFLHISDAYERNVNVFLVYSLQTASTAGDGAGSQTGAIVINSVDALGRYLSKLAGKEKLCSTSIFNTVL